MENPDTNKIEEALVIEYLQANPEFFSQHPELLSNLRMPTTNNGTVSLVERQTQVLREKVVTLQEEITDLMVVARQNEKIYQIFVELYIALLECDSLQEVEGCVSKIFAERLQMSAVTLKLYEGSNSELAPILPKLGQKALQENRLIKQSYYLGRLNQAETQWLFAPEQQVASVALVQLGDDEGFGLLAIASEKDEHFQPQMDTLFIGQLQRLLTRYISKLLK